MTGIDLKTSNRRLAEIILNRFVRAARPYDLTVEAWQLKEPGVNFSWVAPQWTKHVCGAVRSDNEAAKSRGIAEISDPVPPTAYTLRHLSYVRVNAELLTH